MKDTSGNTHRRKQIFKATAKRVHNRLLANELGSESTSVMEQNSNQANSIQRKTLLYLKTATLRRTKYATIISVSEEK
jgi:hypothetical protein